jgi:flagellar protein FlgJ
MGDLDRNFSAIEFFKPETYQAILAAKHNPAWHIDPMLVNYLQAIRDYFGKPVKITSGYRTQAEHLELEKQGLETGAYSFHCEGKAADIVIDGITPQELQEWWKRQNVRGGLGCGKTFTHIDTRNSKELITWGYSY